MPQKIKKNRCAEQKLEKNRPASLQKSQKKKKKINKYAPGNSHQ
jgi:hypothetical protein